MKSSTFALCLRVAIRALMCCDVNGLDSIISQFLMLILLKDLKLFRGFSLTSTCQLMEHNSSNDRQMS